MISRRLVFGLAAVLFLCNLGGAHDLWAPDEPYFAEGAREMLIDGRWLVPHVNGVMSTDKPPLFFWAIALLSLPVGGVTHWTARLPSALAALGTVLLVMRLGRRFGGERVAWLAGLTVCTTLMFWEKARWTQIEALLCFLVWAALSAFEAWRAGDASGRRAGLLFWLAAALAVLAKGPVGMLLPLGIAVVTLAWDRQLGRWREFAPVSGPVAFAAVVGLWMIAATLGSDGAYSVWGALKEHFIDRGIHGLHHRQPPWYYLEVLPAHLMPWTGLVPGALVLAWRRRRKSDRFLFVVALFVMVFFSLSTEKRHLYTLPAVPALALMIALLIDSLTPPRPQNASPSPIDRRWLLGGQAAVGGLLSVIGLAMPWVALRREEFPYWIAVVLGAGLLVTGLATLWACRRSLVMRAALTPAAGFAASFLFVTAFVYPVFDQWKSARSFSLRLKAATERSRTAGHEVIAFDLGNLPEAFAFYSDGVYTVETKNPEILAVHLRQPAEAWAVLTRAGLDQLAADVRGPIVTVETARLSREEVLLVTNRDPDAGPGVLRAPSLPER